MSIRRAILKDAPAIRELLIELGYPFTDGFLAEKMEYLQGKPGGGIYVYETEKQEVIAFVAIQPVVQLARRGDSLRISYFSVKKEWRGNGIGSRMEKFCVEQAKMMNCSHIELRCHERRKEAHQFYFKHGYHESPKYFIKNCFL